MIIPNIVHFIHFVDNDEDFLFCYYISVLSCKLINSPDNIFFYYSQEPKGHWWEKTKKLVKLVKVDPPTHIGSKEIKNIAHKSDALRMCLLQHYGGIYLDTDTICVKSYRHLLSNKFVISNEITNLNENMGLCNAVVMCQPKCKFINLWSGNYEAHFQPDGWQEASTLLPYAIYLLPEFKETEEATILGPESFLGPSFKTLDLIFEKESEIPEDLIVLHLWNRHSKSKYLDKINNFDWAMCNEHTLYGKALIRIMEMI